MFRNIGKWVYSIWNTFGMDFFWKMIKSSSHVPIYAIPNRVHMYSKDFFHRILWNKTFSKLFVIQKYSCKQFVYNHSWLFTYCKHCKHCKHWLFYYRVNAIPYRSFRKHQSIFMGAKSKICVRMPMRYRKSRLMRL
jgi:hypothetical protein